MSSVYFPNNAGSSSVQMRPVTRTTIVTVTSRNAQGVEADRVETFNGGASLRDIYDRFGLNDTDSEAGSEVLSDSGSEDEVAPPEPCYPHIHNRDAAGQPTRPYLAGCACLDVPATPVTLPWQVPAVPGLNPHAVQAVGIIHKTHTLERMRQMVPYLEGKCRIYNTTPAEVAVTLMALHNIHQRGNLSAHIDDNQRQRALSVAMEMHGATAAVDPDIAIRNARKQPWTRTIEFAGELSINALYGTGFTSTAAAATYMCGVWAGTKIASAKAAAATSAKLKAGSLAAVGVAGTAALGSATIVVGGMSVVYWVNTITAFRDVWDNNFAKDAFFFHKMREHNVLPGDNDWVQCRHRSGEWSSPLANNLVGRRGIKHN